MVLFLAPIPTTAGPVQSTSKAVKPKLEDAKCKGVTPKRANYVSLTAKMVLEPNHHLHEHFIKWLNGGTPSKRKAAEFLRLMRAH